jgi:hypothetical protein
MLSQSSSVLHTLHHSTHVKWTLSYLCKYYPQMILMWVYTFSEGVSCLYVNKGVCSAVLILWHMWYDVMEVLGRAKTILRTG